MLSPDFIDDLLDRTFAVPPTAERDRLVGERARVATEITNLTSAIAQGGDIPALVKTLAERDAKLKTLDKELAKPVELPDREVLKAALELRSTSWRETLRSQHVAQARVVLQHLIEMPILIVTATPPDYIKRGDTRGTENIWRAQAKPEGLLTGLVPKYTRVASQSTPNWNQIASFLESMQRLRDSVGFAG